jgi:hypothetical protein
MKIYIAMAEMEDGSRIMENAYKTKWAAEKAANSMAIDLTEGAKWTVTPIIEELTLNDE